MKKDSGFEIIDAPNDNTETEKKKDNRWWNIKKNDNLKSSTIFELTNQISNNQYGYWKSSLIYAQLYENIDSIVGSFATSYFTRYLGFNPTNRMFNSKLTYNIVKSCIDSAVAKIGKNKPRVKFITSGGDHAMQVKAKKLTKYVDGLLYNSEAYKYGMLAFKDSCIFGTGCVKIYVDPMTDEIKIDRIIVPSEIVVDYADGRYGFPKQLHQIKLINKDVLLAHYPEMADEINHAEVVVNPNSTTLVGDQVVVIESWHLPSSPKAKDGNHCICLNNAVLLDEEYKKDYFPFVFYKWTSRVEGFFGLGLAEELAPIQLAINKLHKMINAGMEINTVPRWFVEAGSLINKHSFYDGGIGEMKPGSAPPVGLTTPAMTSDVYQYLETMYQKGYQTTGISLMAATAQKPAGLNSGVAQREYNDLNDARFAIQGEQFEQMYLKIARIMIDLTRDLYKDKSNLNIKTKSDNKHFIESIDWKDADLNDDYFIMQCFPVSRLPTTPEGRLSFITELMQAGVISRDQGVELMEMPDIDNFYSLYNAAYDSIMSDLDAITEKDEIRTPEPFIDLSLAIKIATAYYLRSKTTGMDEDILQRIRDYIDNINQLISLANPPPAPTTMPGQPGEEGLPPPEANIPQAISQRPPRSELMEQNPKGKIR